jgi:hypothetical protein
LIFWVDFRKGIEEKKRESVKDAVGEVEAIEDDFPSTLRTWMTVKTRI